MMCIGRCIRVANPILRGHVRSVITMHLGDFESFLL